MLRMLRVYGQYKYYTFSAQGSTQNLTSLGVGFCRFCAERNLLLLVVSTLFGPELGRKTDKVKRCGA